MANSANAPNPSETSGLTIDTSPLFTTVPELSFVGTLASAAPEALLFETPRDSESITAPSVSDPQAFQFFSEVVESVIANKPSGGKPTFRLIVVDDPGELCKYPVGGNPKGQAFADNASGCIRRGHSTGPNVSWAEEIEPGSLAVLVSSSKSLYILRNTICSPAQVKGSPSVLTLLNQELDEAILYNITKQVREGTYERQHENTQALLQPEHHAVPETPSQKGSLTKREHIADELLRVSKLVFRFQGLLGTPSEEQPSQVYPYLDALSAGLEEISEDTQAVKADFQRFAKAVQLGFVNASTAIATIKGIVTSLQTQFNGFGIAGGRSVNPTLETQLQLALDRIAALEEGRKALETRAGTLEEDVTLAMEAAAGEAGEVRPTGSATGYVSLGEFNTAVARIELRHDQLDSHLYGGSIVWRGTTFRSKNDMSIFLVDLLKGCPLGINPAKFAMDPWLLMQYALKQFGHGGYKEVASDQKARSDTKMELWEVVTLTSTSTSRPEAFGGELSEEDRAKGIVFKKLRTISNFQNEDSSTEDAYAQLLLENARTVVKSALKQHEVTLSDCPKFQDLVNSMWEQSLGIWEWIIESMPLKFKKALAVHCSSASACPASVHNSVFRVFMLTLEQAFKDCRERRQGMVPFLQERGVLHDELEMATQFFFSSLHSLEIMTSLKDQGIVKHKTFIYNSELVARSQAVTRAELEVVEAKIVKKSDLKILTGALKTVVSNQDSQMTLIKKLNEGKTGPKISIKAAKAVKGFKSAGSDEEDA